MAGFLRFSAATIIALAPVVAAADVASGKHLFEARCALCHSATAGGHKPGPSLFGVVGRQSGTVPGFAYSKAMQAAAITWSPATLESYLAAPRTAVPGNKMTFPGLTAKPQRDDVIAYLGTLK